MRISDWSSDVCSSDLTQFLHLQSSDIFTKVPGMRADVTHAARFTRQLWVGSPSGIVPLLQLDAIGQPALRVLHINASDLAQPTGCYAGRSEERSVGKECVSTCRSRGSPVN